MYRVAVDGNETLRVRLLSEEPGSANEIYLRYNDVPSGFAFDASIGKPVGFGAVHSGRRLLRADTGPFVTPQ
jgi:hypothetical protein